MNIEQKDQITLDNIRQFYNNVYYKGKNAIHKPQAHLKRLAKMLNINSQSQILDVACGNGEWLLVCRNVGATVCGVDISDKAIDMCREFMPSGEFFTQPAETLPFKDGRFDVVTCFGALEHFVQPEQALREMARVAKPGAIFILLVPNADFLTRKLGFYSGTYQVDAKEEVRTLEEWQRLFACAGLTVEKRWKDLHVISWQWITLAKWYTWPLRAVQALMLTVWPLRWQYQVYHWCVAGK